MTDYWAETVTVRPHCDCCGALVWNCVCWANYLVDEYGDVKSESCFGTHGKAAS